MTNRAPGTSVKSWLLGIGATIVTVILLSNAKDYPCLRGAGLALSDFEAFLLSLIGIPCFAWSLHRLLSKRKSTEQQFETRIINGMAIFTFLGSVTFFISAAHLIFFTASYPIRFLCEQPYLSWLFKFPM
jgi:hypothetical protein